MKLAVMKDESSRVPGGGYHYNLHPFEMRDEFECKVYQQMGYIIIEVEDLRGKELIKQAKDALNHQVNVAVLADAAEKNTPGPRPINS
jgi:hypothetical protein